MAEILIGSIKKGEAGGVAELDASGHVPVTQLPSYVNDVLEFANLAAFPAPGETGKIYIATDTNKTYRWSGAGYAEISDLLKRQADTLYANALIGNVQGDIVHVEDAWEADAIEVMISGKSMQDGTPTPDAPVEIDVIDSPVSVQAAGKNIYDNPYNGTFTSNGATYTANADGVFHVSGTSTRWNGLVSGFKRVFPGTYYLSNNQKNDYVTAFIEVFDKNKNRIGQFENDGTFVLPPETYWMKCNVGSLKLNEQFDVTIRPQLELGSTATTYEPYTSNQQTITLPSDHNYLASLPDGTRDELVLRADGVAVLTERVGKVSPSAFISRSSTVNNKARWAFSCPGFLGTNSASAASYFFCNKLKYGTRNQTYSEYDNTISDTAPTSDYAIIYSAETALMTLAEANAWLAANPIEVYYAFAVPSIQYSADNGTTWSTTDPNAGNSAIQLYKGTNNVWCTDALSPNVSLEYVQDTTKVINELRAAIVASGATS